MPFKVSVFGEIEKEGKSVEVLRLEFLPRRHEGTKLAPTRCSENNLLMYVALTRTKAASI